MQINKKKS